MTDKQFRIDFGNDWRKYSRVLRNTAPEVVDAFRGTELEDNFDMFYELAVPQKGESPIGFLLRNIGNSCATTSPYHEIQLGANYILARLGWYITKVPLLRRVLRLNKISTGLYIGQETRGYVSDDQILEEESFGNDDISTTISNFTRPTDLDIDVGFTNPNSPRNGRNWFYQINIINDSLIEPAERASNLIEKAKSKKKK